ncbi:MAG: hypothetical protein PHR53_04365 [Bacteroidales bacterium]|nr:hypothetical protein [Bacteroidales bacterium]
MKITISSIKKWTFHTFVLFLLIAGMQLPLSSQTYMMGTHRTVTGCSGTIFDNGGFNGNYGPGRNDTMTIISNDPTNSAIKITFLENYNIDENDTLYFYNGNTAHPDSLTFSIGSTGGSWVNNSTTVSFAGVNPPSVIAQIPGSGAITLRFKTKGGAINLPFNIHAVPTNFQTKTFNIYDVQLPFIYGDSSFQTAGNHTVWYSCDSAVNIILNVTPTTPNTGYEEIHVCDTTPGALPFDYIINGSTLYTFTQTETRWFNTADTSVVINFVADALSPTNGSFINGYTKTCNDGTNHIITYVYTDMVADIYEWIYPNGDTIYNHKNFIENSYTAATINSANGYYMVSDYNECGRSTTFREIFTFYNCSDTIAPQESITGDNDVCANSTQTYEVLGGAGTTYTWTITPPESGTILSGQGSNKITVQWNGNGNGTITAIPSHTTAGGFKLGISCTAPCQPLSVFFDENLTTPPLHFDTTNHCGVDGYKYIDVCPNSPVSFVAYGQYNYSGFSYYQGDDSTTFIWKIGDETIEVVGRTAVSRTFQPGLGYNISLTIKDQRGCTSGNAVACRVRTSRNPIKDLSFKPVCVDSSTVISVGYNASNLITIEPVQDEQVSSLTVTETIFLPDGEFCPPYGELYRSPVVFTSFSPQAKITSANDIRYLRINMEHSFIGDIRIALGCYTENGTEKKATVLPAYQVGWPSSGNTGNHLGLAKDSPNCDGGGCAAASNLPGVGWTYCWSNNNDPELGYVYSTSPNKYIYENANEMGGTDVCGNSPHTTIKPSVVDTVIHIVTDTTICYTMLNGAIVDTVMEITDREIKVPKLRQAYRPTTAFFPALNGCKLNGTWFVEVEDLWGIDNGYIFEWEMALNPELLPPAWKYNVAVDSVEWNYDEEHLNITYVDDTTLVIRPLVDAAGTYPIGFTIQDDFGCSYDSSANIIINGLPNVTINGVTNGIFNTCMGESAELGSTGGTYYLWNNMSTKDTIIVNTSGTYDVTVTDAFGCENFDTAIVIIHDAPAALLDGSTEGCHPVLEINPQAPILCSSIEETGFDIYDANGNLIAGNWPDTLYTDTEIIEEGDYLYKVVSRYDDIHIPIIGDILCSDGTYDSPDEFVPTPARTAIGVLFWINDGTLPNVTDDYWVVGLANINRTRAWGSDTIPIPIPYFTPTNASTDYAGQLNTDSISTYTPIINAAIACRSMQTPLPLGSYWSLPACGQMAKLDAVLTTVNNSLTSCGGAPINSTELLWTSTQADTAMAYAYDLGAHNSTLTSKTTPYKARPISTVPLVVNRSDTAEYTIKFQLPEIIATATPAVVPIGGTVELYVADPKDMMKIVLLQVIVMNGQTLPEWLFQPNKHTLVTI